MSGSEYLLWSYGQFEKMTFFPPDPLKGANIHNAYLQAPSSEKHFIMCGPEFGIENEGRVALIW